MVKLRVKKVKRIIIWNGFSISLPNGDFGTATLAIDDIRFLSSFCLLQLCRSLAKRGLLTTANSNRHIARTGMQLGLRVRFYPIVVTSSYQKTTVLVSWTPCSRKDFSGWKSKYSHQACTEAKVQPSRQAEYSTVTGVLYVRTILIEPAEYVQFCAGSWKQPKCSGDGTGARMHA